MILYKSLDVFFLVFHTLLILFNLVGWIWRRTRRLNLITLLLTGMSWFILGIFFGIGYCPFTDWHFGVLAELGEHPDTPSYIDYLLQRLLNLHLSLELIDALTAGGYFAALAFSIVFSFSKR
jgi:hypothetical protein